MTDIPETRFRNDAAIGIMHVQTITEHEREVRRRYHCPDHGERPGQGFGGQEYKQLNCTVAVSDVKLCWKPLRTGVVMGKYYTFEWLLDLEDLHDRVYFSEYDHDYYS